MRILMVLDHPYPPDLRLAKETDSLVGDGHEVCVLSIGPDDRSAVEELRPGVQVRRYRISSPRVRMMRALAASWPRTTTVVAKAVAEAFREWPFDAVHVHDLYLAGGGVKAASAHGVPCMVDLHEHWSVVLDDYRWSSGFPRRLIVGRRRWRWFERRWLPRANGVTVVSDEMSTYYDALHAGVLVVPNFASLSEVTDRTPEENRTGPSSILYAGALVPNRGLDTVLRAMPAILRDAGPVRLDIVGDGVEKERLQHLSAELGVAHAVAFAGWVPQAEISEWIGRSTICINPLRRTRQTDVALSHKLFQYMIGSRPVVVSDCTSMERVVKDAHAGIVVPDGDVAAFSDAIIRLLRDPDEAARFGRQGRAAVLDRYNWEEGVRPLLDWYADRERRRSADDGMHTSPPV